MLINMLGYEDVDRAQTGHQNHCCSAHPMSVEGQEPALPHRNMGVCFDLQQRTLSIVFSVAP